MGQAQSKARERRQDRPADGAFEQAKLNDEQQAPATAAGTATMEADTGKGKSTFFSISRKSLMGGKGKGIAVIFKRASVGVPSSAAAPVTVAVTFPPHEQIIVEAIVFGPPRPTIEPLLGYHNTVVLSYVIKLTPFLTWRATSQLIRDNNALPLLVLGVVEPTILGKLIYRTVRRSVNLYNKTRRSFLPAPTPTVGDGVESEALVLHTTTPTPTRSVATTRVYAIMHNETAKAKFLPFLVWHATSQMIRVNHALPLLVLGVVEPSVLGKLIYRTVRRSVNLYNKTRTALLPALLPAPTPVGDGVEAEALVLHAATPTPTRSVATTRVYAIMHNETAKAKFLPFLVWRATSQMIRVNHALPLLVLSVVEPTVMGKLVYKTMRRCVNLYNKHRTALLPALLPAPTPAADVEDKAATVIARAYRRYIRPRQVGRAAFQSLFAEADRCEAQLRALESQRGKKTSIRKRQAMKLALENKLAGLVRLINNMMQTLHRSLTTILLKGAMAGWSAAAMAARVKSLLIRHIYITPLTVESCVKPVFACMLAGRVVIGDDARAAPLKACGHTMLLSLASHPDLRARLTPKVLRDRGLAVAGSNHPHAQWLVGGLYGKRRQARTSQAAQSKASSPVPSPVPSNDNLNMNITIESTVNVNNELGDDSSSSSINTDSNVHVILNNISIEHEPELSPALPTQHVAPASPVPPPFSNNSATDMTMLVLADPTVLLGQDMPPPPPPPPQVPPAPVDGPPAPLPPGGGPAPEATATLFHAFDHVTYVRTIFQHADPDSAFPCDARLAAQRVQECEGLASVIAAQGGQPTVQLPPDMSPRASYHFGVQVVQIGSAMLLQNNFDGLAPTLQLIQQAKGILEGLRRVNLGALQELSTVGCMTSQLRLHNKMASAMHGLLTAQVLHWANLLPNPAHFQVLGVSVRGELCFESVRLREQLATQLAMNQGDWEAVEAASSEFGEHWVTPARWAHTMMHYIDSVHHIPAADREALSRVVAQLSLLNGGDDWCVEDGSCVSSVSFLVKWSEEVGKGMGDWEEMHPHWEDSYNTANDCLSHLRACIGLQEEFARQCRRRVCEAVTAYACELRQLTGIASHMLLPPAPPLPPAFTVFEISSVALAEESLKATTRQLCSARHPNRCQAIANAKDLSALSNSAKEVLACPLQRLALTLWHAITTAKTVGQHFCSVP